MSLKVSGERFLAEALADAMDRDLADVPPREQLEQQHRFSKKFVRRMKRLETAVKDGRETQTVAEPSEKPQSGGGKIVDFRRLGAMAKRYSGLAAALVCVIGLAAVVGVMSQSLRMGKSFTDEGIAEESAADTAAPEEAWEDATEEPAADTDDDAASGVAENETADDSSSDSITDTGSPEEAKGEPSPGEQPEDEQEAMVPDWQEELLLESAKADELVTWHLSMIYDDGSIGLTSDVVNPAHSTGATPGQSLYVSGVFEVYYEQSPDEWECVYRTKRSRDNYSAATSWDEWYALDELNMTQAGTYRLVRQVNSYRQVLQLTLDEQ
ncbi:MAG: hypothetical protein J6C00_11750 [Eubacterium sp.]|nr:hypothetical protein [Eubacterium sp.]